MSPRLQRLALLCAVLPSAAVAYPQYIAKGYTNCATCHYSPSGGGLPNSYGHAAAEATFPDRVKLGWLEDFRGLIAKRDVTGTDDQERSAFQYDLGLDARAMALKTPTQVAAPPSWIVFPMLAEVGGVVAYGPLLAYGTVTPRPSGAEARSYSAVSREHWIQYKIGAEQSVRLGRLVLPFGLRIPDHTAPTREDFGFNKYDQWYAMQWDYYGEHLMAAVAAFDGTLVRERVRPGERGLCATLGYNLPSTAAIGFSALGAISSPSARFATSLFLRWRPFWKTYVMGELAFQQISDRASTRVQREPAGMVRAGVFLLDSADLYAEVGGRTILGAWETTKLRYLFGVDWKLLPWVELSPAYLLEETVETGLSGSLLAQLHVFW